MSDLKFGDVVFVKSKLHRTSVVRGSSVWKEWQRIPFMKHKRGILIGFRTLTDGIVLYGQWDEPTTFLGKGRFKAFLVALDARSKPFFVRIEDVVNDLEKIKSA